MKTRRPHRGGRGDLRTGDGVAAGCDRGGLSSKRPERTRCLIPSAPAPAPALAGTTPRWETRADGGRFGTSADALGGARWRRARRPRELDRPGTPPPPSSRRELSASGSAAGCPSVGPSVGSSSASSSGAAGSAASASISFSVDPRRDERGRDRGTRWRFHSPRFPRGLGLRISREGSSPGSSTWARRA